MTLPLATLDDLAAVYGVERLRDELARIAAVNVRAVLELAVEDALFPGQPPVGAERAEAVAPAAEPQMNDVAIDGHIAPPAQPPGAMVRAGDAVRRSGALSRLERLVVLHLLALYRQHGRIEPGYDSIALALGCSDRMVRRAVRRIGDGPAAGATPAGLGLFAVVLHGGRHHANSYLPRWDRLLALVPAEVADGRIEPAPAAGDAAKAATSVPRIQSQSPTTPFSGSGRHRARDPDQLELRVFAPVGQGRAAVTEPQGQSRAQRQAMAIASGEAGARDRLAAGLRAHAARFGPRGAERFYADVTPAMIEAGEAAERARPGGGVKAVLTAMYDAMAPPGAAGTR